MLFSLVSFSHTGWLLLFALIVGISTSRSAGGHSGGHSSGGCSSRQDRGAGKCASKGFKFFSHILLLSFPHTIDGWVVLWLGSVMVLWCWHCIGFANASCLLVLIYYPCPHPLLFMPFSHTQVDCRLCGASGCRYVHIKHFKQKFCRILIQPLVQPGVALRWRYTAGWLLLSIFYLCASNML